MTFPKKIVGPWTLSQLHDGEIGSPKNGLRVLSTFACGGGSTMGWKLAGFEVIGCVEIDPKMAAIYKANHNPKHLFQMPIQEFNKIPNGQLPEDITTIDILDGSPPCSSFSMSGSREDAWGSEKKFREGQAKQVLDDLFFHYLDTVEKLRPAVAVAENVKGLVLGKAKGYVKEIFAGFDKAGYEAQLFLLNSSRMGVPQRRERTFFIARRKDLGLRRLSLHFEEPEIPIAMAVKGLPADHAIKSRALTPETFRLWSKIEAGQNLGHAHKNGSRFNAFKYNPMKPAPTLTGQGEAYHWAEPRRISAAEAMRLQSFPDDFNFVGQRAHYVCGMSVPPLMMQRIALEISNILH